MEQLLAEQADLISSLLSQLRDAEQALEDVMIVKDTLQDYFVSIGLPSYPDRVDDVNLNKIWETIEPWNKSA